MSEPSPGGSAGFAEAVAMLPAILRVVAYQCTSQSADLDDAVQQTIAKILEEHTQGKFSYCTTPELIAYATKKLRQLVRDNNRRERRFIQLYDETYARNQSVDLAIDFQEALDSIPDSVARQAAELYIQGMRYADIANKLGISMATVSRKLALVGSVIASKSSADDGRASHGGSQT